MECEQTIHELFKTTVQSVVSNPMMLKTCLEELEWKILCCVRMNAKMERTDIRLHQLIPIEIHDLNTKLQP